MATWGGGSRVCEVRTIILFVVVGVNYVDGSSSGVGDCGSASGTLPYYPWFTLLLYYPTIPGRGWFMLREITYQRVSIPIILDKVMLAT